MGTTKFNASTSAPNYKLENVKKEDIISSCIGILSTLNNPEALSESNIAYLNHTDRKIAGHSASMIQAALQKNSIYGTTAQSLQDLMIEEGYLQQGANNELGFTQKYQDEAPSQKTHYHGWGTSHATPGH